MEAGQEDFHTYFYPIPEMGHLPTMKEFNSRHSYILHSTVSDPEFQQDRPLPEFRPLIKIEGYSGIGFSSSYVDEEYQRTPATQLQLADLEFDPDWPAATSYPQFLQYGHLPMPTSIAGNGGTFLQPHRVSITPSQPMHHIFDDAALRTPWSSPEITSCQAVSALDDEDEMIDDKPYARLIYDALMQAPDHRMMLRDIYEWFRKNTTKAQDNATNGWQNSIRHNLSMNKVS